MPSGTSGGVIYSGGNVGQRVKAPPNIPRNSGNYHYPSNKGNMGSMNRKPIGAKPSIHHHHYHHYYSSQGIGSRPRSDQFKDMLVGAAAGHLIYKAGQSIINRPSDPFIWSGRPYYWTAYPVFINNNGGAGNGGYHTEGGNQGPAGPGVGSEAARGSSSTDLFGKILCSMPLQNDPKFEKIRFDNGTQPKEIVWHCRYNEMCCGSECCASNTTKLGTAGLLVSNGVYFNGVHLPSLTAMVLMWLALIFN